MRQQYSIYDVPEIQPMEPDNGNAFNSLLYVQSIKLVENSIVKSHQLQSLQAQSTLSDFQIKVHDNKIIDKNGCYIELDESGKLKPDTNPDDIVISNIDKNLLFKSIFELIESRGLLDDDKKRDLKIKFINKFFLARGDICCLTQELVTEIELKNIAIIYKKNGEADQFTIYDSLSLEQYIDGKARSDGIFDPLTKKPFDIEMDMIFKFNKKFNIYGIRFSESLNSNFNRFVSLIGSPNIALTQKIKYINECDDFFVDINDSDKNGHTLLHHAVLKSDLELIPILINKGIDIDAKDSKGNTALYLAISNNKQDIISTLIDHGADIDKIYYEKILRSSRLSWGEDFFVRKFKEEGKFFEKLQDEEFCEKLKNKKLEQEDFEKLKIKINVTYMNKTFLHYAVEKGDLILIQRLIEMGANPNINSDKQQISPLNIAIENKRDDIIYYLIQKNSDIKFINKKSQKSLLHYSVSSGNLELTRYLIKQGLDINLKDSSGKTPLHYAVISGNTEIVRLLLESDLKIDVNAIDLDQKSVLHHAIMLKSDDMSDIINLLLSANANPKLLNNRGYCALHEAVLNQNVEAIELLANNPENAKIVDKWGLNSLHLISKNNLNENSLKIVKLLKNKGIDIDASDENGNPLIVSAIKNNQIELVKTLIDLNAKTDFLKDKIIDEVRCCDSLLKCFRKPPAKLLEFKGFIETSRIKLSQEMTDLILPIINPDRNFLRSDNQEIAKEGLRAEFEFKQVSSPSLTLPAVTDQQNSMIHDDSAIIMSTMPQARVEGAGGETFNKQVHEVFRC